MRDMHAYEFECAGDVLLSLLPQPALPFLCHQSLSSQRSCHLIYRTRRTKSSTYTQSMTTSPTTSPQLGISNGRSSQPFSPASLTVLLGSTQELGTESISLHRRKERGNTGQSLWTGVETCWRLRRRRAGRIGNACKGTYWICAGGKGSLWVINLQCTSFIVTEDAQGLCYLNRDHTSSLDPGATQRSGESKVRISACTLLLTVFVEPDSLPQCLPWTRAHICLGD